MLNRIRRAITRTRERYPRTLRQGSALPPACTIRTEVIQGEATVLVRPYIPAIEHLLAPAEVF
ncbi:hypothetical protein AB0F57_22355 [Streptomyces tanashiensis]|uniref:hypothetical protein n=1 Tax=Streptomyces tanashiensis TaxID=67367 RepID=UPI003404636F